MIRDRITDPWREVTWDEAIARVAVRVPPHPGRVRPRRGRRHHLVALHQRGDLPGAEAGPRSGFGNNNVDTCARVCHSPTGYGLEDHLRRPRAGTQDFDSVEAADVILVIGANPTDGHPVFASPHEAAAAPGRQADRRRPAPHRPRAHAACRGRVPPAAAARHQRRGADRDGARHRHRGPGRRGLRRERCDADEFQRLGGVRRRAAATRPRRWRQITGVDRPTASAPRPGSTPPAATRRSTTASASPSTARARPR